MAEGYDNRELVDEVNTMSDEETSDDYLYSEAPSSDESSVDFEYLEWYQLREYDLLKQGHPAKKQTVDPKGAKCDSKECIISLSGNFALYLCYVCNLFLCGECMLKHDETHEFVSVESETDERRRMADMFVGRMRSERLGRGIDFDREDVRVHGRINVKHELDERDCNFTGLSGLENKRWVALDWNNNCMKIFCSVSYTLLRYIKIGSKPWDVTEVKVKQKSTDPDSASISKTDISVATQDATDKQCLLAVTFPLIKQIWFINVDRTPAVINKTIKLDKPCLTIEFNEDKIFTLCEEDVESESDWSIDILSTEGDQLKVIHIPGLSTAVFDDFAVHNGQVFLTDPQNDKVLCINVEDGKIISELTLEGFEPTGVNVDHSSGVLYLCGPRKNKVYKLSPDLLEYEPLSLDAEYTWNRVRLWLIKNKLFVTYDSLTSLRNVVTVVKLLT